MATISQVIVLPATPAQVFAALATSEGHTAFTSESAVISAEPHSEFSLYDGYATGSVLEADPGRRLVLRWKASDWEDGAWSRVAFLLQPDGEGCRVSLEHTDVPEDQAAAIESGWHEWYWEPLTRYFESAAEEIE